MTSGAIAAMLSTILYGRRFFPYYVYNIIGGLDEEGTDFTISKYVVLCIFLLHYVKCVPDVVAHSVCLCYLNV